MRILPYLALLCQSGALLTRPSNERIFDVIITPLTTTSETVSTVPTPTIFDRLTISSKTSFEHSTLITMAPLSRNPLDLRQKCFDDRGFSVDCATWTGYYYTWGPPGDPYAGGPGDDGSTGTSYVGSASKTILPLAISYIVLVNVLTLWAAFSLS